MPDKDGRILQPNDNDVLSGRGGNINAHPGNEQFRNIVEKRKRVYLTARFKREKRIIIDDIVSEIRQLDPPGRFLARDPDDGFWYDVGDEKARDKTGQALRENAPSVRAEMQAEHKEKKAGEAWSDYWRHYAPSWGVGNCWSPYPYGSYPPSPHGPPPPPPYSPHGPPPPPYVTPSPHHGRPPPPHTSPPPLGPPPPSYGHPPPPHSPYHPHQDYVSHPTTPTIHRSYSSPHDEGGRSHHNHHASHEDHIPHPSSYHHDLSSHSYHDAYYRSEEYHEYHKGEETNANPAHGYYRRSHRSDAEQQRHESHIRHESRHPGENSSKLPPPQQQQQQQQEQQKSAFDFVESMPTSIVSLTKSFSYSHKESTSQTTSVEGKQRHEGSGYDSNQGNVRASEEFHPKSEQQTFRRTQQDHDEDDEKPMVYSPILHPNSVDQSGADDSKDSSSSSSLLAHVTKYMLPSLDIDNMCSYYGGNKNDMAGDVREETATPVVLQFSPCQSIRKSLECGCAEDSQNLSLNEMEYSDSESIVHEGEYSHTRDEERRTPAPDEKKQIQIVWSQSHTEETSHKNILETLPSALDEHDAIVTADMLSHNASVEMGSADGGMLSASGSIGGASLCQVFHNHPSSVEGIPPGVPTTNSWASPATSHKSISKMASWDNVIRSRSPDSLASDPSLMSK